MPIYVYRVLNASKEEQFVEIEHGMNEVLTKHPKTGEKLEKVFTAPNIGSRYSAGRTKNLLSNESLTKSGFTKYERDKSSGNYYKTAGE